MTQGFGKADDRFQWSVFLVLCNRLMTLSLAVGVLAVSSLTRDNRPCLGDAAPFLSFCPMTMCMRQQIRMSTLCASVSMQHVCFALLVPHFMGCPKTGVNALQVQKQSMQPVVPLANYATVSLSNVIATSCQYEALKHVSFPVQTLSKCAKMIPVMIWGALIARKTYSIKHCCVAALVTVGCTCFLLSGSTTSKKANDSSPKGFVLMLTYLAFDGFTATFQVFCYHFST